MAGNEKYKNPDIEDRKFEDAKIIPDGTLIQIIPGKLSVIFYPKKSQPSFTDILKDLGGKGTIVLVTSTNAAIYAVKNLKEPEIKNPIILPIVYNSSEEKNDILIGIIEGLGLDKDEVFKNLRRQQTDNYRGAQKEAW